MSDGNGTRGSAAEGRRVELRAPDTGWPQAAAALAERVRHACGALLLRVDPVGATAVPGLLARDVLELQLTVHALEDADALAPALGRAGFRPRPDARQDALPPGVGPADALHFEKRTWVGAETAEGTGRRVVLHLRRVGAPNQRRALLLRDYLRDHPAVAAAYGAATAALAAQLPDAPDAYGSLEGALGDVVLAAAEDWAARQGWVAGAGGPPQGHLEAKLTGLLAGLVGKRLAAVHYLRPQGVDVLDADVHCFRGEVELAVHGGDPVRLTWDEDAGWSDYFSLQALRTSAGRAGIHLPQPASRSALWRAFLETPVQRVEVLGRGDTPHAVRLHFTAGVVWLGDGAHGFLVDGDEVVVKREQDVSADERGELVVLWSASAPGTPAPLP